MVGFTALVSSATPKITAGVVQGRRTAGGGASLTGALLFVMAMSPKNTTQRQCVSIKATRLRQNA